MEHDDNIADQHRKKFESIFLETQVGMVRRLEAESMPNAYIETVAARLIAYRVAVTAEPPADVANRVLAMARDYLPEARSAIALARMILRSASSVEPT